MVSNQIKLLDWGMLHIGVRGPWVGNKGWLQQPLQFHYSCAFLSWWVFSPNTGLPLSLLAFIRWIEIAFLVGLAIVPIAIAAFAVQPIAVHIAISPITIAIAIIAIAAA